MTYAKLLCVSLGANWRRLWAADAISSLGDGAYAAAIPLLAVYFTRSPAQAAGVATAASLPWLLCSPHAGALADRYDRRRLMSIAQIVQAFAVSIAAVTAMVPGGRIWMLYVTLIRPRRGGDRVRQLGGGSPAIGSCVRSRSCSRSRTWPARSRTPRSSCSRPNGCTLAPAGTASCSPRVRSVGWRAVSPAGASWLGSARAARSSSARPAHAWSAPWPGTCTSW
jgi:MFS family permease